MKQENAGVMLAAAIENERFHKREMDARAHVVDAAKAKRADLVGFAATGAEVDVARLMQAEDATRAATAEFEIADAVHKGAERQRQEAEIAAWFDMAEKLRNAVEAKLDERFAAAIEVDCRMASLNLAVTRFNDAGQSFSNAMIAASHFTADRDVRIASNPILAAMPAGTHPNAKNNYSAEIRRASAAVFNAGGGLERQIPIQSLAHREVLLWGRKPTEIGTKR